MKKSLTHIVIIVHNMETQSLKLPLESLLKKSPLKKIMSSSISPPCCLPTVQPVVAMEFTSLPTGKNRKRVHWSWDR
jgi:hypothetical protein